MEEAVASTFVASDPRGFPRVLADLAKACLVVRVSPKWEQISEPSRVVAEGFGAECVHSSDTGTGSLSQIGRFFWLADTTYA